MEEKSAVEAALFTASDSLTAQEISDLTGIEISRVRYAVKDLRMEYEMRNSVIIISAIDGRYRMQLRAEYMPYSGKAAVPEFNLGVMRTLSAIAYNQPVPQSAIIKARGPRGYTDVSTLVEAGYVSSKPSGRSYELRVTKKFCEDFGIGSTKDSDIKAWIERNSKGFVQRKSKMTDAGSEGPAQDATEGPAQDADEGQQS